MLELLQLDTGGALGEERALRVCLSVCLSLSCAASGRGKQPINEVYRWDLIGRGSQRCSGRENTQRGREEQCGQEMVRGSARKE